MLALVKNIVASADGVKSDPAEQEKAAQLSPKTRIQYLDAPTLLKVGDIVNLTFIAEPSLARMYPVGDDGMIRVPFMGPLKVVGLNANQIREGIGKWMAEHKLGSVDQVTVQGSRVIK